MGKITFQKMKVRYVKTKTLKLMLESCGSYLGMEKGCFVVKDEQKKIIQKHPLFESDIDEVILRSGNYVSTGALVSMGFWNIDCLITTQRGNPVAMLRSLDDDSHVETRLCQYEAFKGAKGLQIAKELVKGKIRGQDLILAKYGFKRHSPIADVLEKIVSDDSKSVRTRLLSVEGRYTKRYFKDIFQLFPEQLRPENRKTFKAYDGLNNIFNLAYEVLQWKVHQVLLKAKLEPYLGFLHSTAMGKPSLILDFMELYRYLIDDFLIQYCKRLKPRDFVLKTESLSTGKKGKRQYLSSINTRNLFRKLNEYFLMNVEIPRVRYGKSQEIETLINEEAFLLAQYLRNEKQIWIPRTPLLISINVMWE
jgi:CRISPR-associated protein Cas1